MTRTSAHVETDSVAKFSDLPISSELKKGITELGYVSPTAFQLSIFESFVEGRNVIGQGQSSYGKSLAFFLPILVKAAKEEENGLAVVVCEGNAQVELTTRELKALGRYLNISITNDSNQVLERPDSKQIVVITAEDFLKTAVDVLTQTHTVFLDNLTKENATVVVKHLNELASFHGQLLIFGADTLAALTEHGKALMGDAVFINNSDQPKIALPTKHVFHQVKEDEPKPRALLAVMEFYRPKFALITCSESQECDLLARYLSRYGFRIKTVSEDNDR
ncbi:MAG TPA: DEAD/DEAH box helicase, partial [Myxococcota bacterium]|nr:DEAD/DEAH box helicase [Myxococcota bacterium]